MFISREILFAFKNWKIASRRVTVSRPVCLVLTHILKQTYLNLGLLGNMQARFANIYNYVNTMSFKQRDVTFRASPQSSESIEKERSFLRDGQLFAEISHKSQTSTSIFTHQLPILSTQTFQYFDLYHDSILITHRFLFQSFL